MEEKGNIKYYQIPSEMSEPEMAFEDIEPRKVGEAAPATMEKIEKFQDKNRLYFQSIGKNVLSVYGKVA